MDIPYWTANDYISLAGARTYNDLCRIAVTILKRMPKPIAQVCGPISTGGAGSIEGNLKRFADEISKLKSHDIQVFDQIPFEGPMQNIKRKRQTTGYDMDLLRQFYLPIFESRYITRFYFLSGWETSTGARWEHRQAKRLNIDTIYLE